MYVAQEKMWFERSRFDQKQQLAEEAVDGCFGNKMVSNP